MKLSDKAKEILVDKTKMPKKKTGLLRDYIFEASSKGKTSIVVSLTALDEYQQTSTIEKLESEGFTVYQLSSSTYEIDWGTETNVENK